MNYGCVKGEICNRDNCSGTIEEHERDDGCSCHINPPCNYCTSAEFYCPVCGWESSEDQQTQEKNIIIPMVFEEKLIIEDDGFLYNVIRYFDSIREGTEGSNLKNGDAVRLLKKCNNRDRCYVSYDIEKVES